MKRMSKYKVILFDVDDTLICNESSADSRFELIFEKIFRDYGVSSIKYTELINKNRIWYFKNEDQKLSPTYARNLFWQKILKELNISLSIKKQKEIVDLYWQKCLEGIKLKSNVDKVLSTLKDHRYKLGILSNGDFYSKACKLTHLKVDKYFSYLFTTELVGKNKFSTDIYKYAIETLNINPEDIMMVGDTIEQDVVPANKVSINTVLISKSDQLDYKGRKYSKPDFKIKTLDAILKIVS